MLTFVIAFPILAYLILSGGDGALAQVLLPLVLLFFAGTFFLFRCPRCKTGRVMRPSLLGYGVPDRCPVCGLDYTKTKLFGPVPPADPPAA